MKYSFYLVFFLLEWKEIDLAIGGGWFAIMSTGTIQSTYNIRHK